MAAQGVPYVVSGYRTPGDMPEAPDGTAAVVAASGTEVGRPPPKSPTTRRTYYRHDTFFKCWRSVWCYWHNETVNIHTHLWGAVTAMLVLALQLADVLGLLPPGPWPILSLEQVPKNNLLEYYTHLPLRMRTEVGGPEPVDMAMMTVFLLAAMVCLGCSATYHTVSCHSRDVARRSNRLDYIGIVVLIIGSNFPLLHFGFHCHPTLRTIYLVHVSIWGMLAFYVVTQPRYMLPQYKGMRTAVFVALGLSGIVPLVHGFYISRSWHFVVHVLGAKYVMCSGAAYIIGACIYVAHIPERWRPRTFDLLGASHQIFHVCVLLGAWLHWVAVHRAYTFWHAVETIGGEHGQDAVCAVLHRAIAT